MSVPTTGRVVTILIGEPQRLPLTTATMEEASSLLPQGDYTTFRTYSGRRVLRLGQHLRRLERSIELEGKGITTIDDAVVRQALGEIVRNRAYDESRIRLTFAPPRLYASIEAFVPLAPELFERGVRCATVPVHRDNPEAKDTRFLAKAADARRSLPPGVHEGLLVQDDGTILEGLSSNFFAVVSGILRTEGKRVLQGVTRSLVVEASRAVLPLDERAVFIDDLLRIEEAFITSVSREILPVVEIDGSRIGAGVPGPKTRMLIADFHALVEREAEELT